MCLFRKFEVKLDRSFDVNSQIFQSNFSDFSFLPKILHVYLPILQFKNFALILFIFSGVLVVDFLHCFYGERKHGSSDRRCSMKKVFLKVLRNLLENNCAIVSFLIRLQAFFSFCTFYFWMMKILTFKKCRFHVL